MPILSLIDFIAFLLFKYVLWEINIKNSKVILFSTSEILFNVQVMCVSVW